MGEYKGEGNWEGKGKEERRRNKTRAAITHARYIIMWMVYSNNVDVLCNLRTVTQCAGCISTNTRPDQLL